MSNEDRKSARAANDRAGGARHGYQPDFVLLDPDDPLLWEVPKSRGPEDRTAPANAGRAELDPSDEQGMSPWSAGQPGIGATINLITDAAAKAPHQPGDSVRVPLDELSGMVCGRSRCAELSLAISIAAGILTLGLVLMLIMTPGAADNAAAALGWGRLFGGDAAAGSFSREFSIDTSSAEPLDAALLCNAITQGCLSGSLPADELSAMALVFSGTAGREALMEILLALTSCRDPRVIPAVVIGLDSPDPEVASQAADTLASIDARSADNALILKYLSERRGALKARLRFHLTQRYGRTLDDTFLMSRLGE